MVNNADNETIRLLFAILQQKNPKEIDWNLVAESEFLTEPIKNGHAARMRYCRLRDSICKAAGISEDKPKGRRTSDKGGVTKSKHEPRHDRRASAKSDYAIGMASLAQFSPASIVSSTFNDSPRELPAHRFLTPCSDDMTVTHMKAEEQNLCAETGEGFPPPGSQFLDANTHDPTSPNYAAFNNAMDAGIDFFQNEDPLLDYSSSSAYNNTPLFS